MGAHKNWADGWPVVVTIFGWLAVLSGLARMPFPTRFAAIAIGVIARAIDLLLLGPFLSLKGYARD